MAQQFDLEVTDTFGGEANYSWVQRFRVTAKSPTGAIRKVSRHIGTVGRVRKVIDTGDMIRHDVRGAAVCIFTTAADLTHPLYRRNVIEL